MQRVDECLRKDLQSALKKIKLLEASSSRPVNYSLENVALYANVGEAGSVGSVKPGTAAAKEAPTPLPVSKPDYYWYSG